MQLEAKMHLTLAQSADLSSSDVLRISFREDPHAAWDKVKKQVNLN